MKVLVTGGAGFIGSHIVDSYLKNGLEVIVVDNLITGKRENLNPEAKFYEIDICSPHLEKIFQEEKPEILNHHAAQIDVRKSVRNPFFDAQVNIMGTINLLRNCLKYKVKKIIFASSGGVIYGEAENGAQKEDLPPRPISPYGISKLTSEQYIKFYNREYGLKYTILRYGNVYGPRQDPAGEAGVVAIFIKNMLEGKTSIIYGDGEQVRDFVYIEDVVKANILVLKKGENEVINIGTSVATSINQLYFKLQKITNFKHKPVYGKERKGELKRSLLDIEKAGKILNWFPCYHLERGLEATYRFFKLHTL